MASPLQSLAKQRPDQIFPPSILWRSSARAGSVPAFTAGESPVTSAQVASGLMVILADNVTEHGHSDDADPDSMTGQLWANRIGAAAVYAASEGLFVVVLDWGHRSSPHLPACRQVPLVICEGAEAESLNPLRT
jgi:hypothetical protein